MATSRARGRDGGGSGDYSRRRFIERYFETSAEGCPHDAVANLILEEGMKFAKSDVKPARVKFNDTLCLYTVVVVEERDWISARSKFIGTARVTHRRLYLGDQKKRYKNVPLEFGTIEVEAEGRAATTRKRRRACRFWS